MDRSAPRHGGGLLRHGRHQGRRHRGCSPVPPRAGSAHRCAGPTTSARPGRRRPTARSRSPRAAARRSSGSGSSRRAPSRRRRLGRHRAGRGVAVRRRRRDLRARARRCGTTRTGRVGRRLRRPGVPHDPPAPDRPDLGHRRDLDRRRLPHHRRRRARGAPRNQGIRAEFLPEGQQYPEFGQCVHKVTRHPARPERLFLQNHGGVYRSDDDGGLLALDRRRAAQPTSASRSSCTRTSRTRSTSSRIGGGDGRYPPDGQGAGLALRATPATPGSRSATGCRTPSTSR